MHAAACVFPPAVQEIPMKTFFARSLLAASVLFALGAHGNASSQTRYTLHNLASLGGTSSTGNSINTRGWVTGRSNLPGNQARHATLWRDGRLIDLGTLGGPNSVVVWPVKNLQGIVSGIAQTAEPDPLHENWSCSFFFPAATRTGFRCLGFRWQNGLMTPLPTLGGTHGFAAGTNNRGETTGWAENTVADPTCVAPQVLQFRAVLWDVDAHARELPPLAGDSVSAATALNDRGDVVGISGICDIAVGQRSAIHAVRWQDGVAHDLGNIGGDAWNTPTAVNERGDIVGFANIAPGTEFNPHAFLWTAGGGMVDLGTLPGDATSQASGINDAGQIVGQSCNAGGVCRGFVWERGVMRDLQPLVVSGDDDYILTGNDIDDTGRITGQAFDNAMGTFVAFVAVPVDE
jgi:probable HAF family extracellular repeat protein